MKVKGGALVALEVLQSSRKHESVSSIKRLSMGYRIEFWDAIVHETVK